MTAVAAGVFRRTPIERSDQWVSWERTDQAFFASGACHILAWACRDAFLERSLVLVSLRFAGEVPSTHAYATWGEWAFDHSGWNAETDLLTANETFEGRAMERVEVAGDLAAFCAENHHRMPEQYWRDPWPRARDVVAAHVPPWRGPA